MWRTMTCSVVLEPLQSRNWTSEQLAKTGIVLLWQRTVSYCVWVTLDGRHVYAAQRQSYCCLLPAAKVSQATTPPSAARLE